MRSFADPDWDKQQSGAYELRDQFVVYEDDNAIYVRTRASSCKTQTVQWCHLWKALRWICRKESGKEKGDCELTEKDNEKCEKNNVVLCVRIPRDAVLLTHYMDRKEWHPWRHD